MYNTINRNSLGKVDLHILLADDDKDDCDFFQDALEEIGPAHRLTTVNNGVDLMQYLRMSDGDYPDLIFLDLNMPRKSGMECVTEIKDAANLSQIPVVIYSTSLDRSVVERLHEMGAYGYIQKPGDFTQLRIVVEKAVSLFACDNIQSLTSSDFIIQP